MNSCIYQGRVRHRRWKSLEHAFDFSLFMLYLDLDELPGVFRGRWLWSDSRPAPARFRRADHLGDPRLPLADAVRDVVESHTGRRPEGPIRLLTHLRYWGLVFNPVSFYYCFEADGERLAALVAEVANTPWNERHLYVVGADGERTPKAFHVSPFMDMEMIYRWSWMPPSDALRLRIESRTPDGDRLFDASLALQRVEITGASLARVLTRHPWMTLQVLIGIYWQAWRLRRRGAPFFPHPGRAPAAGAELVS